MRVVTVTLSIAPGHTPAVKRAALETLQASPAARQCRWMLSAELGEVNTLLCAFAEAPLDALLEGVGQWIAALRATPAATSLRHARADVHETAASTGQLARLAADPQGCVLLQVLGVPQTSGVCLSPVTGQQDAHLLLSAASTHDEALALASQMVEADTVPILDSSLWLPVPVPFIESMSS